MFIIMPINQKINIMAIAEILKLKMIDDLTSLNPRLEATTTRYIGLYKVYELHLDVFHVVRI